jgi:hypothetical protein
MGNITRGLINIIGPTAQGRPLVVIVSLMRKPKKKAI